MSLVPSTEALTEKVEGVTVTIMKSAATDGSQGFNAIADGDSAMKVWEGVEALPPPFDQRALVNQFEQSNALRQNVDAYATNIDSFGHAFIPVVDIEADDTIDRVRSVMMLEAQAGNDSLEVAEPSDEEVQKRIKKLANEQRMELLRLETFFDYCSETSFPELRSITRQDIETTGNGYWEVRRTKKGDVARFNHVPSWTVRLMPLNPKMVEVEELQRNATLGFTKVTQWRRFRTFVQRVGDEFVYFKEFGDPRTVSALSGKFYDTPEALVTAERNEKNPNPVPATEMVHFKVHSSRTPYGIPRWIGNLLSVLGSRQCEEVNYNYFENKSVPPLALLVTGGRLGVDSKARLQDYIKNEIRGKDNFHKILIIEAESPSSNTLFENSGQTKIELKPLVEAQTSDALFQNYDERNIDKVGMAFRLPRMLRGDTRDFNRSTSFAALDFAERQVFEPKRQSFDAWFNRYVLPPLGIKHWKLKSNGPAMRDPESLSKMIHDMGDVLTPNTALELAQEVFGRRFSRIKEEWGDKPIKLTIADIATQNNKVGGPDGGDSPEAEDSNPDNQSPNDEATQTNAVSDNKGEQGKTQGQPRNGGKFGPKPKPKAPSKPKRPTVKKSAEEAAEALVSIVELIEDSRVEEAVDRIRKSRKKAG